MGEPTSSPRNASSSKLDARVCSVKQEPEMGNRANVAFRAPRVVARVVKNWVIFQENSSRYRGSRLRLKPL